MKFRVGAVHNARGPVWSAAAVAVPGAEGRPVVFTITMHRCDGAEWGVGVAGGRRARLIRRWRGRRASLTPRSHAVRAARFVHADTGLDNKNLCPAVAIIFTHCVLCTA